MEKKNASQYPKVFYARHMEDGLAGYGDETILVENDAVKLMMPSFEGKPVYVLHDDRTIEERMANIHDADGLVVSTFYNKFDGWVWSKIIVTTDAGFNAINAGWAVSNAYVPTEWGAGGLWHDLPYDRKILNGEFTHLAIVDNPRYENACIKTAEEYKAYCMQEEEKINELQNSKTKGESKMTMKLFKNKREAVAEIDSETLIEFKNHKGDTETRTFGEMAAAINEKQNEAEKEKLNAESTVEFNGEKMSASEFAEKYNEAMSEDEKENESDEDEKTNSKHFYKLKGAEKKNASSKPSLPSLQVDRLAAGKKRF